MEKMTYLSEKINKSTDCIYLIYDGKCLLCSHSAKALILKKAVGKLITIDARSMHPLVTEVKHKGYDLNEGIIVKYNDVFYHGTEAAHLLALLSSPVSIFNRINAYLFKYTLTVKLFYPILKAIRKVLLFVRGIPEIQETIVAPTFAKAFGKQWDNMPELFRIRYGNDAFKDQEIAIKGKMNITVSKFFSFLSPLLRMTGSLVPYKGKDVAVDITFESKKNSAYVFMNRTFHYPGKNPYSFNSRLMVAKDSNVLELMRFGVGIKMQYRFSNNQVNLNHQGYVMRILGVNIPIPLRVFLGKVYAHEIALDQKSFSMLVKITHPILGKIFEYDGIFELAETS